MLLKEITGTVVRLFSCVIILFFVCPLTEKILVKLLQPLIGLSSGKAAVEVEVQKGNSDSAVLHCQIMDEACQTPRSAVRNQTIATGRVLSFIVDHLLQKNESLMDLMVQHLWTSVADMVYRQVRNL